MQLWRGNAALCMEKRPKGKVAAFSLHSSLGSTRFLLVTKQKGFWFPYKEVSKLVQALGSEPQGVGSRNTPGIFHKLRTKRKWPVSVSHYFLSTAAHHPLCFAPTLNMVYVLPASPSLSTPNEKQDRTKPDKVTLPQVFSCLYSTHSLYRTYVSVFMRGLKLRFGMSLYVKKNKRFPRSPVASRIRWGKMARGCQEAKGAGEEREGEEYFQQQLSTTLFQSQDASNTIAFSRSFPIRAGDA